MDCKRGTSLAGGNEINRIMKELLIFILENITGSKEFEVDEQETEQGKVDLLVKAPQNLAGLIIGKQGKTIKNIRRLVSVRAALEDKVVNISLQE